MPPNQQQQKKLHTLLTKINNAIDQGYTSQAIQKLNEINKNFPKQSPVHTLLGKAHGKMGRHNESIGAYQLAVEYKPNDGELRFFYAQALQRGGRYEQALMEYERAIYHAPKSFNALRHKCAVLTDLNRTEEAYKALQKLEKTFEKKELDSTRLLGIAITRARLSPKIIQPQEAIEDVEKYVHLDECEPQMRIAAYWQLGRLYDHIEDFGNAFHAYKSGKELGKTSWDPDQHSKRVDQLIECWTTNKNIPQSSIDGSNMIFIVGMMRSGTSLTEQMLAQNPDITPGGEMNAISRQIIPVDPSTMTTGRPYALTASKYTQRTIEKMAHKAKAMYDKVAKTKYLTDKQPYNFAHVPLIAHLFPGCKIIHCKRDPLDCCVSNYTQSFAQPHHQTHELYWVGRYYRDYERIMNAWASLDEVNMIDLQYEELVSDPETQTRRVFDFLGFEWTPDVLNFHKSKRTVSTASRDQVRKPMYTSSVQKYKRYEEFLDDLKRGLEE